MTSEIKIALDSKKIDECTNAELDIKITSWVIQAFAIVGKKINDSSDADVKIITGVLPAELVRLVPKMRIKEIPIAFKRGLYKEFGEYFGINVAELVRFCRSHYESEQRINATRLAVAVDKDPEIKQSPSPEERFGYFEFNLLHAFNKRVNGGDYEAVSPSLYDTLTKIGVLNYDNAERWDMFKEACRLVIQDHSIRLTKYFEDFKIKPLKRVIEALTAYTNSNKPLPDDIKTMVIIKSKHIGLKAWFDSLIIDELNIEKTVSEMRDAYLKSI